MNPRKPEWTQPTQTTVADLLAVTGKSTNGYWIQVKERLGVADKTILNHSGSLGAIIFLTHELAATINPRSSYQVKLFGRDARRWATDCIITRRVLGYEVAPMLLEAVTRQLADNAVHGPHCHHDECAMNGCDHVEEGHNPILHGCREQQTCPDCGPTSPFWPAVVAGWVDWCTTQYGTTDPEALRAHGNIPTNVIATAVLVEANPVPQERTT